MALQRRIASFHELSDPELAAWRKIPPAVASDCMNRTQVMHARIKPLVPGQSICGQARTVVTMAGDCLALCEAISLAKPGEVIVVDAGAVADVAVWGGIMTFEACMRKIGAVVIDGAVRDVADIRASGLVMFCSAAVPRGPHQGFGGIIDDRISVAGVPVAPGDIILGNDDGVVVVPLSDAPTVLAAAEAHLVKEEKWLAALRSGRTIKELFAMPEPTIID